MKLETFFKKFELFADAPDAVGKMRELVLDLAIQGKLSKDAADWRQAPLGEVARLRRGYDLPVQDRKRGSYPIFAANGPVGVHDAPMVRGPGVVTGRSGSIGKVHFIESDFWPLNTALYVEDFFANDPQFICLLLRSLRLERFSTATAVPTLNRNVVHKEVVRVPPLAEQKRIVAKVDELMALCDRLEAQQEERQARHTALARASLARFAEAPTPANLNFLFHQSYAISPTEMRNAILTLAVQGRLVAQDLGEEPVDELIARIAVLRQSKAQNQYESVDENEAPYEIPSTWAWVRLGSLALSSDSGWSPQCLPEPRSGSNWGVLKVSAVSWGSFRPEENKALPPGMEGRPASEVRAGDFLLSRANTEELVARSVVVDQAPPRLMMSDKIVRFTFSNDVERAYINLANTSYASRDYYMRNASGTSSSMKNIGREVMCNLPIPLPPLREQRRIVARVDQLMALVEQLEVDLITSKATAKKLCAAIVAELTAQD